MIPPPSGRLAEIVGERARLMLARDDEGPVPGMAEIAADDQRPDDRLGDGDMKAAGHRAESQHFKDGVRRTFHGVPPAPEPSRAGRPLSYVSDVTPSWSRDCPKAAAR